jgi:NADH:ubiquinone oxidoreductase subunit F (NADH-binding)
MTVPAPTVPTSAYQESSGLPRLLPVDGGSVDLAAHLALHGPVPPGSSSTALLSALDDVALSGRGGAGFSTARKWAAVGSAAGPKVVVANGSEGEPASRKDRSLLTRNPHLVLDGLQIAAEAVGADVLYLFLPPDPQTHASVDQALAQRAARGTDRRPILLVVAADRYIAGEESAVAAALNGHPGLPRSRATRVFERGVRGRPTLIQNVETLANVALIARYGAAWYRGLGTEAEPGTVLLTVGGWVRSPGVFEAPIGVALSEVIEVAGGALDGVQSVLVGGYHGSWLPGGELATVGMSQASLASQDARLGAGVVVVLPERACGLLESARVARYLADQSAGQCGPCRFGLADIAKSLDAVGRREDTYRHIPLLERWLGMVDGRGACSHPDGSARFIRSTLATFADEVHRHEIGDCRAAGVALKLFPTGSRVAAP